MNMNVMIFSMLAPLKQLQTLWRQIAIRQNKTEPYMNGANRTEPNWTKLSDTKDGEKAEPPSKQMNELREATTAAEKNKKRVRK